MRIKDLIKTEKEYQLLLNRKRARLDNLEEKLTHSATSLEKLKDQAVYICERVSDLMYVQENTKITIDDISFIRRALLWRLLELLCYSKERKLVAQYRKQFGDTLKTLFPQLPLPIVLEDIEKMSLNIEEAFTLLDNLSSCEKDYAELSKSVQLLSSEVKERQFQLDTLTAEIDGHSIVPADPFTPLPEKVAEFEAILKEKDPDANKFTEDQWKFIYSVSRNTYVIAGAGSGKSTTLVYRALFLHRCAGVKLDQITIFTFTKKTRFELIDKLQVALKHFGEDHAVDDLKKIVHTFHSKAWGMGMRGLKRPPFEYFEILGKARVENDDGIETAKCISANVTAEQYPHLNKVYSDLFNSNEKFREIVFYLFKKVFMFGNVKRYETNYTYEEVRDKDQWLLDQTREFAKTLGDDVSFAEKPIGFEIEHEVDPYTYYAHQHEILPVYGELTEYFIHYFYVPKDAPKDLQKKIRSLCTKKRTIIATHDFKRNHVFIRNEKDYKEWQKYKNDLTDKIEMPQLDPPVFEYALPGYPSRKLFLNVLYAEGLFIESLGLSVDATCERILTGDISEIDGQSIQFLKGLKIFWKAFHEYLDSKTEMARFHNVFSLQSFEKVGSSVSRMKNIMIDEFQDINVEISKWIKNILRFLKETGSHCSITCVGDDFQSIYSWRGSAPVFFLYYDDIHNFPSRDMNEVKMSHNFRSLENIIRAGECILKGLPYQIDKKGIQGNPELVPIDSLPVEIYPIKGSDRMEASLAEIISRYKKDHEDCSIFVMSRDNDTIDKLTLKVKRNKKTEFMTYHGSKGLQADICILLTDAFYNNIFPLRNEVYAIAWENQHNYRQTYDEAQKIEHMKLGYVAVTRAKRKVIIFDNAAGSDGFIARVREYLSMGDTCAKRSI
jgi:hypothetical protein